VTRPLPKDLVVVSGKGSALPDRPVLQDTNPAARFVAGVCPGGGPGTTAIVQARGSRPLGGDRLAAADGRRRKNTGDLTIPAVGSRSMVPISEAEGDQFHGA